MMLNQCVFAGHRVTSGCTLSSLINYRLLNEIYLLREFLGHVAVDAAQRIQATLVSASASGAIV